ncbi:DUF742 domain-containing protein [Kitasatospora sp. NPDC127067]|uniref:DUF742 domain-containing protein n=1 Tax=Kitasatospora sp. NPDC127067 TaxID=3347126 RepID=UPI00364BE142
MADPMADVPGGPETSDGPQVPVGTAGPSGVGGSAGAGGSAGVDGPSGVDGPDGPDRPGAAAEGGQADPDGPEVDLFRPRTPVDDRWFDDEAGPVVRLYSMTRGRTRPVEEGLFDLISLVTAVEPGPVAGAVPAHVLDPEHQTLLTLCRREPLSVAELGSYTDLPVSVVRVLLGDLYDAELISVTRPVPLAELPDERLLRDVINGLRAL